MGDIYLELAVANIQDTTRQKDIAFLVGTHILQDFRLVIDMERHTVSRRRAVRAK